MSIKPGCCSSDSAQTNVKLNHLAHEIVWKCSAIRTTNDFILSVGFPPPKTAVTEKNTTQNCYFMPRVLLLFSGKLDCMQLKQNGTIELHECPKFLPVFLHFMSLYPGPFLPQNQFGTPD